MEIIHLEEAKDFNELIKTEKILVDFYANWCGPCRMLSPILESTKSDIKVIKVDTDKFEDLSREYGVMSIPTLVLLEKGKEVKRSVGLLEPARLKEFLK